MRRMISPPKSRLPLARRARRSTWIVACVAWPLCSSLVGCGSSTEPSKVGDGGDLALGGSVNATAGSAPMGSAGLLNIVVPLGGSGGASNGAGGAVAGPYMLPPGFTPADMGGYKLGPAIDSTGGASGGDDAGTAGASSDGCGTQILGVVRDFKGINEPNGHPDFEHFSGSDASTGIVKTDLGSDQKPVYSADPDSPFIDQAEPLPGGGMDAANGQQTTNKMYFDQWYRATANVNKPYIVYFYFEPNNGVLTFQSSAFFPIDDAGWGDTCHEPDATCKPWPHNFGFTTEIHTRFNYKGGETFSFTGDDDLWVFINNKLAIDLGGLHSKISSQVSLDTQATALGIQVGNAYALDLFHAERHTSASNFRVDTNLEFTNCGTVIPEPPPK